MKAFLFITALLGALGVIFGAFGAHGLENKIADSQIAAWKTAVNYQMIHVLVLLIILLNKNNDYKTPAIFFLIGIFLFSGSLYLLSTKTLLPLGSFTKILGPITPIGGLMLIIGWIILAYQFLKNY